MSSVFSILHHQLQQRAKAAASARKAMNDTPKPDKKTDQDVFQKTAKTPTSGKAKTLLSGCFRTMDDEIDFVRSLNGPNS